MATVTLTAETLWTDDVIAAVVRGISERSGVPVESMETRRADHVGDFYNLVIEVTAESNKAVFDASIDTMIDLGIMKG